MKISKLRLKNIKCFKDTEISFEDEKEGGVKNWSLFVGDNGQGKTTILRSLALGLCDKEGASGLLLELYGFLRRDEEKGSIEICLEDTDGKKYTIETQIEGENESVSQYVFAGDCVGVDKEDKEEIDDFERDKIFAVAPMG